MGMDEEWEIPYNYIAVKREAGDLLATSKEESVSWNCPVISEIIENSFPTNVYE